MTTPQSVRYLAAVLGALLVLASARSVIVTVIVPRPTTNWLNRGTDRLVNLVFRAAARRTASYQKRDRILSAQAATLLIVQLIVWLVLFYVRYSLLLWPLVHGGITTAFATAGPALWAVGEANEHGAAEKAILDIAALTSLITIALQIAYLPTLYSAFNHRETEVALLNARSGLPAWGPELLARTHYGLGSGESTINTLPQLYSDWERWGADVMESHTTYPTLGAVPLPGAVIVVARGSANRPRLSRVALIALAQPGPDGPGPLVPSQRVPVPARHRQDNGAPHKRTAQPRRHHPHLPGVPRRRRAYAEGRLPNRARS